MSDFKKFVNAGFSADAPDGPRAFVYAEHAYAGGIIGPHYIMCETAAFMEAIGLQWDEKEHWEILEEFLLAAKPNIVAAIIHEINQTK